MLITDSRLSKLHTVAIGDIHGMDVDLIQLIKKIDQFENGDPYILQPLGDYVDRGPNSKRVIETLMALQAERGKELVRPIKGNHEVMAIEAHNTEAMNKVWSIKCGGKETLESYPDGRMSDEHLLWLEGLPLSQEDDKRFFVHAGVYPGVELSDQQENHMIWIREIFLYSRHNWGKTIVHGHTTTYNGEVDVRPNRINLDTGSCFGMKLSAVCFDPNLDSPIKIIQV